MGGLGSYEVADYTIHIKLKHDQIVQTKTILSLTHYKINTSYLCGDFQLAACQSKQNGAICRLPKHSWTSDRSEKVARVKIE